MTMETKAEMAPDHQISRNTCSDPLQTLQEKPHSDFWVLLEGFRPSGLLNQQASVGKLSLENITHGHNESDATSRADHTYDIPANDPVRLGIVNSTIATSLFAK